MNMVDTELAVLTSYLGRPKAFEFFGRDSYFGPDFFKVAKDEKFEVNLKAISIAYKVSRKVAYQYYNLIGYVDKSALLPLRKKVGLE